MIKTKQIISLKVESDEINVIIHLEVNKEHFNKMIMPLLMSRIISQGLEGAVEGVAEKAATEAVNRA